MLANSSHLFKLFKSPIQAIYLNWSFIQASYSCHLLKLFMPLSWLVSLANPFTLVIHVTCLNWPSQSPKPLIQATHPGHLFKSVQSPTYSGHLFKLVNHSGHLR
jgi:hypothetical protein